MAERNTLPVAWALGTICCTLISVTAGASQFEFGGAEFSLNNELTAGATMRLEKRDPNLVSKLNNNPNLCPEDCLSLGGDNGDPSRNQRLVDAPGGYIAAFGDDGNLRFDQYDITAAQLRLASDLTVLWGEAVFQFTGLGFYDAINSDLLGDTTTKLYHPDNFEDVPPADGNLLLGIGPTETAHRPRFSELSKTDQELIGHDYRVLEAFVAMPFRLFGRDFHISLGEQRVRWGEALFNVLGSLDQLNPVDENRLYFPGTNVATVFEPTGLVVLSTRFSQNIDIETVYQYDWEPTQAAAAASLFNTAEPAGGRDSATLSVGQVSEDPERRGGLTNDVGRVASSTTLGLPVDLRRGQPGGGGQYGARLNWYLPELNGGTDLSFYALNYHSRLPSLSVFATDASCVRDAADVPPIGTGLVPGLDVLDAQLNSLIETLPSPLNNVQLNELDIDAVAVAIACGGFNGEGALAEVLQTVFGPLSPNGPSEPLPIGTMRPFLDYPKDIQMYGLSFNSKWGKWSIAGEYAYRPNQPLGIQIADVLFAAAQPALPDEDINILVGTLPSNRNAVPDYVETRFRGNTVGANDLIEGFERFEVHTLDFTGIRVFGPNNPVGADQIIMAVELGATFVPDIPDPQVLPMATIDLAGASHASPGADGTGQPDGLPDPRSLNPTQQTENYPDDLAAGYRILSILRYNNLIFGKTYLPQITFLHDVVGIAPLPIQNFIEDRKQVIFANTIELSPNARVVLAYQGFFDGAYNNLRDRDNVKLSISLAF